MTQAEAQIILDQIKSGKKYVYEGAKTYTGDYDLTEVYFSRNRFVYDRFDCHPEGGERLVRTEDMQEEEASRFFESMDYQQTLNLIN